MDAWMMDEFFWCNMPRADTPLVVPVWSKGQGPFPLVKPPFSWADTHTTLVITDSANVAPCCKLGYKEMFRTQMIRLTHRTG